MSTSETEKRRYVVFARGGKPGTQAPVVGFVEAERKERAHMLARAQHSQRVFVQRWSDASASERRDAIQQQKLVEARLVEPV